MEKHQRRPQMQPELSYISCRINIKKKPNYPSVEGKVQTILQQNTQLSECLFSLRDY